MFKLYSHAPPFGKAWFALYGAGDAQSVGGVIGIRDKGEGMKVPSCGR
jgi:hypothetical protein